VSTNLSIFKNPNAVVAASGRTSALAQQIASGSGGIRRITTATGGTFKRIVNGEQIGKAIRGEFNAIIVHQMPKVSREFYASEYDADAKPTLPDCWSNLGDRPESKAANPQAANCTMCPKNVDGSGAKGKGRACRFNRRIALLLEGDDTGEVYQLKIPAKSLFGKGEGNTHPYESYGRFLVANGSAPDLVVTTIAYSLEADTMELNFTAARPITDEEWELVQAAQADPDTQRYVSLTVAEADGVSRKPSPAKVIAAPVEPADEDDEVHEPKAAKRAPKAEEAPKPKGDLAAIVNAWAEDD